MAFRSVSRQALKALPGCAAQCRPAASKGNWRVPAQTWNALCCGSCISRTGSWHNFTTATSEAQTSSYIQRKKSQLRTNRKAGYLGALSIVIGVGLAWRMMRQATERAKLKPPKKKDASACWLNSKAYLPFPLMSSRDVTHDTKIFTFELPVIDKGLGLPVASCILTRIPKDNEEGYIVRSYTPISNDEDKGIFELLVKRYENGPMSEHIFTMKPGDSLEVKGPIAKFGYEPNTWSTVGMIAGGTGLTPMLQIIKEILATPHDRTTISLLFANKEEKDVILKDQLDGMAKEHPGRFQVQYTLDRPPENWTGEKGFVSKEMVEKYMPPTEQDGIILVCGPRQMVAHVCGPKTPDFQQGELGGVLAELGYPRDRVYKF